MRTLSFGLCAGGDAFRASVALPDEYFDDRGLPKWHLLNARFSSPSILWDRPIGAVPVDEPVVNQPKELPPIGEELQKLREVLASLEQKCYGVGPDCAAMMSAQCLVDLESRD
jgi:hypothetical protein